MDIFSSARKHGINDDDMRHAVIHATAAITAPDQPDFTMTIGPDSASQLPEIEVLSADDNNYVIHAMPGRPKYLSIMEHQGGDQR